MLARRDPFRDFDELSQRFQRLWSRSDEGDREALALADWAPSVNISETNREYRLCAEVPGLEKNDVSVTLDGGVLTIQGDRHETKEEKGERYHRREVSYGHFLRRFSLPEDADPEKIEAKYADGMLDVTIAKTTPAERKAKKVEVH